MAKATITTASGTKLIIEGTPEEVAATVQRLEGRVSGSEPASQSKRRASTRRQKSVGKAGPVGLISELIDGGYFRKPKELSAIKMTLEEQAHFYPVTTLSPALLRLVRKRQLRRIKDKNRWLYVG